MNRKDTFDAALYIGAYDDLKEHGPDYVEQKLHRLRAGTIKAKGITPAGLAQDMAALTDRIAAIRPVDSLVLSVFGSQAFTEE